MNACYYTNLPIPHQLFQRIYNPFINIVFQEGLIIPIYPYCVPAYEGEDSTSFMEYLVNNILFDIESFIDKNESNLKESTKDVLWNLEGHPNEEDVIFDSRNKFGNMWCELGKTNPDFRRNGGFEIFDSTQSN